MKNTKTKKIIIAITVILFVATLLFFFSHNVIRNVKYSDKNGNSIVFTNEGVAIKQSKNGIVTIFDYTVYEDNIYVVGSSLNFFAKINNTTTIISNDGTRFTNGIPWIALSIVFMLLVFSCVYIIIKVVSRKIEKT